MVRWGRDEEYMLLGCSVFVWVTVNLCAYRGLIVFNGAWVRKQT